MGPTSESRRRDARVAAKRDVLVTLAVALAARGSMAIWASGRFPAAEDGHYYDVLARRIASGAGFTWLWPDGAVTFAAHYPVGYPALLAGAYALFGASPAVAMAANAVLGAIGAAAAHVLALASGSGRSAARVAGLCVAVHPALLPYTAALMTEGVTASLLLVAAAAVSLARRAEGKRRQQTIGLVAAGVALGVVTLVRPQSLLLAPVFGALGVANESWLRRLVAAVMTTAVALACVAPWTARNCARMHHCALVSVNGGWNLLIGASSGTGAWQPVDVPEECATVWDEAAKDACFERAAVRRIEQHPLAWAAMAPAKLAVTFDYFGGAPWYLHSSAPDELDDRGKRWLGGLETIGCRLFLVLALAASARLEGPRRPWRLAVLVLGAVAALTVHGWLGYLALPAALALAGPRAIARAPLAFPVTGAVVLATAVTHVVFFGAGRYGLVVAPFVAVLAAMAGPWRPGVAPKPGITVVAVPSATMQD